MAIDEQELPILSPCVLYTHSLLCLNGTVSVGRLLQMGGVGCSLPVNGGGIFIVK